MVFAPQPLRHRRGRPAEFRSTWTDGNAATTSLIVTMISSPTARTGTQIPIPAGWICRAATGSGSRSIGNRCGSRGGICGSWSRSHLDVGDFHEWIYRSRRRAEEQLTRTLATDPPLFGCAEIGCDCDG